MPSRFRTKTLKIADLALDSQNPRFVALNQPDQTAIIEYLITHEQVIELSRSIANYGGLMPGELPIVLLEHGQFVVLEGNRRICACKILLDPALAPATYRNLVPPISKTVRPGLKTAHVHIVNSRDEAQVVLGTRHIQGIKTWPSVSKFMFFARHYEAGKTIAEIRGLTGVSVATITTNLRNHYFLQYILSLDCWSELEKQNLINYSNLHQKGVDRILRVFRTEGASVLNLSYDAHCKPQSTLPDFGKIVEHIVRRVFNILPGFGEIDTRTTFTMIQSDLAEWLPRPPTPPAAPPPTEPPASAQRATGALAFGTPPATGSPQPPAPAPTTPGQTTQPAPARRTRQTEFYFENLAYNLGNSNEDSALSVICEELKRISRGGGYRQYPLAASVLTRLLIEQSCKRYLKISDGTAYARLCPPNRDSSLKAILVYFCNNPALFPEANYHRLLVGLFPSGAGIKDLMDLNVHHPHLSMPTGTVLEGWVSSGLKNLLEYLLR